MRRELIGGTVGIVLMVAALGIREFVSSPPSHKASVLVESLRSGDGWEMSQRYAFRAVWNPRTGVVVLRHDESNLVRVVDNDTGVRYQFGFIDRWHIGYALDFAAENIEKTKLERLKR